MIKEYFVKNLAIISDVNVAKKENSYMFLSTPNFKFLDIKNYLAPGLSYDAWCRAYGCELQKLAFPYEWLDSFEKLNHKGPVKYEEFYSSLKGGITISQEEYQNFCDEFHKRGCETMKDWLKEYNLADVKPFIEALEKTKEQYYPDEIDLLKDAVSIPGISMMYVLNEALKRKKYSEPDLFAPGEPCKCKCSDDCEEAGCKKCKEIRDNCKICTKNEAYEILTTGMIGGPSIVFCRYAEAGVSKIRSHIYRGADAKICRSVQGLDANSLYLFCSGQEMPCGKEKVFHCDPRERSESEAKIIQNVLNDKLFGFFQVDIEVPEQLREHFSEFSPLFVISEVPEGQIPQHMQDYKINTGRKKIKNNKKLLGVMKAEKILLYSPLLKWYLNHGLQVTKIHRYISYTSGRPFKWFPEEVSSARRAADQDKNKKQLGDTAKLKGNSFYGKMIENLEKHMNTKFTTNEKLIDEIFKSPFFEDAGRGSGQKQHKEGSMSRKVVLIEDERNIIEAIGFLLSREGWEVKSHSNGADAVDAVRRHRPALVILDVMLPGKSGFDVLREIRDDAEIGALPVLMLTARGQERDRALAEASGVSRFMTKPFSNAEMLEAVAELAGE